MRRKITWLFLLITLTIWTGCAAQQSSAPINESVTPLFEEGHPEEGDGTLPPEVASLKGTDRDNWERFHVLPPRGLTPHYPHYFKTGFFGKPWPIKRDRPSPLFQGPGHLEDSARLVTTGGEENVMDRTDVKEIVLGPIKFAADLGALPIRAAFWEKPNETQYSPQE